MSVEGVLDFFQVVQRKVRCIDEQTPLCVSILQRKLKDRLGEHVKKCLEERPKRPCLNSNHFFSVIN